MICYKLQFREASQDHQVFCRIYDLSKNYINSRSEKHRRITRCSAGSAPNSTARPPPLPPSQPTVLCIVHNPQPTATHRGPSHHNSTIPTLDGFTKNPKLNHPFPYQKLNTKSHHNSGIHTLAEIVKNGRFHRPTNKNYIIFAPVCPCFLQERLSQPTEIPQSADFDQKI